MNKQQTYLIIDAGNTRIKLAYFQNDELLTVAHFQKNQIHEIVNFIGQNQYDLAILSSVLSKNETKEIYNRILNCKLLSELTIPISNKYKTIKTLGADRLANTCASISKSNGMRLIIDVGTCIKFDFVDENNNYLGGSISPGIQMRYKALHEFTGNLPLLNFSEKKELIGDSTENCIHSGVLNGIQGEISQMIQQYESKYKGLTIFVTGGDYKYFDYCSKNGIFADSNLTLFGLLQILKANES